MRKHDSFEDDGRTIADMSGVGPTPTLLPHSRKPAAAPEPVNDRPWEQPNEWTAKEKFWAVMGALKATLLIAGVYLAGLGVLLAIVVGGAWFGIPGMALSVPTLAVVAALLKQAVGAGLAARGLDADALDRDFPPMDTQN